MLDLAKGTAPATGKGGQKVKLPYIFPWPYGDLIVPEKGCGLGDPLNTTIKNLAQPWREQIGYWIFVRDAATHALVLPGGAQISYFNSGPNDPPPATSAAPGGGNMGANWVANISNTNLFEKGAPIPRDFLFAALTFAFSIGRPFALAKDIAGLYTAARDFAPWSDSYGARARDLLWSSKAFQVAYKDSACNFDLGASELYAAHAGQLGGETVRAGAGFGLANMLPVDRGPVYLGAADESTQAKILGFGPSESLVLSEDPNNATQGDLAVPVRVIAYGEFGSWCGPCSGPSADEINAMVDKRASAIVQQVMAQLQAAGGGATAPTK